MTASAINLGSFNAIAAMRDKVDAARSSLSTSPRLNALRGTLRKTFESSALRGAAVTSAMKIAGTSAANLTGYSAYAALFNGVATAGYEASKDYRAARENAETRREALRTIATMDNGKKYLKKFATQSASFMASSLAVGFDEAIELMDNTEWGAGIKDKTQSFFGAIKETTTGWLGSFKETATNLASKAINFAGTVYEVGEHLINPISTANAEDIAQMTQPMHIAYAEQLKTQDTYTSSPDVTAEEPEIPQAIELSTNDKLTALTDISTKAQGIIDAAIDGDSQAMDDAGVGLLHGVYGFPKNPALAIEMLEKAVLAGSTKAAADLEWALEHSSTEDIVTAEAKPPALEPTTVEPETMTAQLNNINTDGWNDHDKSALKAAQKGQAWGFKDLSAHYALSDPTMARDLCQQAKEAAELSGNKTILTMANRDLLYFDGVLASQEITEVIAPSEITCDLSNGFDDIDCSSFANQITAGDTITLSDSTYDGGKGITIDFTNQVTGNTEELLHKHYIPTFEDIKVSRREFEADQVMASLF